MSKVVVIGEVENTAVWEKNFRSHQELFKNGYSVKKPIHYAIGEGNRVAVCFEPDDLDAMMKSMESEDTAKAMAQDGVKRETVSIHVLDKTLDL